MKLTIATLIVFLFLLNVTFAASNVTISVVEQSFKDRVILSPDVPALWNFQRGVEELYRFVKFTSIMRIGYSLELSERRIGEMEILASKNESSIIPTVESAYELEIGKIQSEMSSTDIFSIVIEQPGIKENVTQRLEYDIKVLGNITQTAETKDYIDSAVKRTSDCVDFISKLEG